MKNSIQRTDIELKKDVVSLLKNQLDLKVRDIGILVEDGIVILTGNTTSPIVKTEAIYAVQGLAGVRAVEDNIQVELPDALSRADEDIAVVVTHQMESSTSIPRNR